MVRDLGDVRCLVNSTCGVHLDFRIVASVDDHTNDELSIPKRHASQCNIIIAQSDFATSHLVVTVEFVDSVIRLFDINCTGYRGKLTF